MKKLFSIFLALVVLGGATLGGLELWGHGKQKPSNWFQSDTEQGEDKDEDNKDDNGGIVITPIFCEAIDLRIRSYSEEGEIIKNTVIEDENGNEVTGYSDRIQSCTITATVLTEDGGSPSSIQSVEWTIDDPNEYNGVEMNVTGMQATFSLIESFSQPITVTITSTFDRTIQTTIRFDYARRISNVTVTPDLSRLGVNTVVRNGSTVEIKSPELNKWGETSDHSMGIYMNSKVVFDTVGTVCDEILSYKMSIAPSEEFHSKLRARCDFCQEQALPITFSCSTNGNPTAYEQDGKTYYKIDSTGFVWFTELSAYMYGLTDWETLLPRYAAPPTWFKNIKELAEECNNEYVVTIEINSRYGGTFTQEFYLDFKAVVNSVNTDIPSHTF